MIIDGAAIISVDDQVTWQFGGLVKLNPFLGNGMYVPLVRTKPSELKNFVMDS